MFNTTPIWLTLVLALGLMGCGKPCEELEAKMCKDLGDDCEFWRKNERPGFPGTGSRPTKSCVNALTKYDALMDSAKTVIKALKEGEEKVKAAKEKRDEAKSGKAKSDDAKADSDEASPKDTSKACTDLEEKICGDLGAEPCAKWKDGGKAGLDANATQCKMALDKDMFYKKRLASVKSAIQ